MPLNVTLSFPSSPGAAGSDLVVRRYELREELSALYELTVEVLSSDPSLDENAIVGQPVDVDFGDEPFLKQIHGIVRRMEQRTAVPDGSSHYVFTVVPPLWLTTRRRDHRIFQNLSVPEIVEAVLADPTYGGHIPAPDTRGVGDAPAREYVVQYAETDHDFLFRILADQGIATYFDHANASTWTLVDDTSAAAPSLTGSIPFSDPSNMNALVEGQTDTPHVLTAVIRSAVETSSVTLRDYDFEKPERVLEAKKDAGTSGAFTNESPLEAYTFEVGAFTTQPPGDARAAHRLDAARNARRRILCTSNFALPPGTRMPLVDHPRQDLAGDFLVVRTRTEREGDDQRTHELELMDLAQPFRPTLRPKSRIHGTQTAFVVGAEGQEIDVDKYGRVEIEFRWDRRDKHTGGVSRRVRVAQGWAGAGFGFVMLPRVNEEVIVAYLDGDPDQPIIVGRVHNALVTTPLKLPADKAISVWRSRSTPKSDGYNEILMDDQAGAERLTMHAQRDFKQVVERDAETIVGRNESRTVKGNRSLRVVGNQTEKVEGDKSIDATGALSLHGDTVSMTSDDRMMIHAGAHLLISCGSNRDDTTAGNHALEADAVFVKGRSGVQVVAPKVHVFGGEEIHLQVGGSSIHITDGAIKITSAGDVEVNGAVVKLNC
ncbi:VgrG protein [Minicystis rosea]|nr:VgrG protein [Minicystis rosea]